LGFEHEPDGFDYYTTGIEETLDFCICIFWSDFAFDTLLSISTLSQLLLQLLLLLDDGTTTPQLPP
jgi:hypothetical protein